MPAVRFILGRAGAGKTTLIVDEIAQMLAADPLGEPIYLLVPDQATLLYERLVAERSPTGGYLRVQVTTFRKLTERILNEAGGEAMPEVTPLGRRILIGRLLRRLEDRLTFYRSTARQPGLAGKLDDVFAELEDNDATDASIESIALGVERDHPQSPLPAKLRDIRLLFAEYERLLGTDRLDPRRRQRRALDAIARCPSVPRATLFVDGFYDLTRPERQMLYGVAQAGARTTIALDVDPRDANVAVDTPVPIGHPLRVSTHAFRRLASALAELRVPTSLRVMATSPRFAASQALLHLERNFERSRPGPIDAGGDVRAIEAVGRRAEVDAAARQILDWLAAGVRLRDVLVLARDVGEYETDVEASFRAHRIPHFIDRQEPAAHQPLIRAIRAVMQLALSDWTPDRVLELLKSGLVGIEPDTCDAVENYVVAHRIRGRDAWASAWRYRSRRRRGDADEDDEAAIFEREDVKRMNDARRHVIDGVGPLLAPDGDAAAPTGDWCARLCRALDRLGVRARLSERIAAAQKAGDVAGALRTREVWHEFAELLDQLCTVLSGEPLTLREFSEVVDVALERFVLAIIPPTVDQVLVGSVDRTRNGPVRGCIVLGLNEGQFPRRTDEVDAFSDDDRRLLADRDVEVRPPGRDALLDEQFLAYLAVTRPSERLTLIRSHADAAGRPVAPSVYWTRVLDCFRGLPVERVDDDAAIATPAQLAAAATRWARADRHDATALRLTRFLFDSASGAVGALRHAMVAGMSYDNAAKISRDVAARLFPDPLRGSATRLETYAACPFKHFAQHALRLSRREEADLTRMEVGTMYHRVLEELVRDALATRHDLVEPIPDLEARIHALGHAAALELREELLLTPGRTQHLIEVMERTLRDVADTQRHALGLGKFRPTRAEMAFGGGGEDDAPPLSIDTPGGHRVELRGKVDRVDTLPESPGVFAATVIDYKLGGRPVNFDRIYYGLSLQLVTYLLVLSSVGEKWIGSRVVPAAALYVKLARDLERVPHPSDAPAPATPEYAMHKSHKARGVIDDRYAGALDAVTVKGYSPAYSIQHTDKPIELRRQDVLDHDAFVNLVEWSRGKVAALVDQIVGGHIEVRPYRIGTETPCPRCDFRAVCRLDLTFNRYFTIESSRGERLRTIVGAEGTDA